MRNASVLLVVAMTCGLLAGCGGAPVDAQGGDGKVAVNGVVMDEVPEGHRLEGASPDAAPVDTALATTSGEAPVVGLHRGTDEELVGTWYPVTYCSGGVCSDLSSGELDLLPDGTCVLDDGQGSRNEATWSDGVIHKRTVSDMAMEVGDDGMMYGHDVDGWGSGHTVFSRTRDSGPATSDGPTTSPGEGKVSVNGIVMDEVPEGLR